MVINCCFTGHRNCSQTLEIKNRLENTIRDLIKKGVYEFYAGGAIGWDTVCADMVLKLKNSYPQIKLNLILPCSKEEQTAKWTIEQKNDYERILVMADSVKYTSDHYFNGCMKMRNAELVEMADYCICYYKSKKSASGTGQTVRMAQKKGIIIINLAE